MGVNETVCHAAMLASAMLVTGVKVAFSGVGDGEGEKHDEEGVQGVETEKEDPESAPGAKQGEIVEEFVPVMGNMEKQSQVLGSWRSRFFYLVELDKDTATAYPALEHCLIKQPTKVLMYWTCTKDEATSKSNRYHPKGLYNVEQCSCQMEKRTIQLDDIFDLTSRKPIKTSIHLRCTNENSASEWCKALLQK
uniref:PH domain-containing protein n=1 Tax=Mucochytrium quahogii TaxID=96639 RepID=A0A7S2S3C4_9STRA|mmetsp:Transcript_9967/g.16318  ORF Transcript_9967/g.16318 Transcript_9967/m.16318 type:complete len:193 (-) Transcript_9967:130-708(-)|eukprot:CAMPEP_0203757624 /NCGR_PEP_ID=MMETSP0098-20131031/10603_1 /ASSEMBLY_ACC=CAM_ASM_000208 /TAXON_ID=96639 /ORGANISM=" , Strain NY0313808BC1" /LENGTH=192 /DNA_ID=CAMNT_0050649849 /DNA_START=56 /DNA_END=634 /DNA_ORIENTATION=+